MKNRLKLLVVLILVAGAPAAMAQYGFGTNKADASAVVDITSTTLGFLPPRMTADQLAAIPNPADGLVVFNTTKNCLSFCVRGQFRCVAPLTDASITASVPTITTSGSLGSTVSTTVSAGASAAYQWYVADDASGTNARPIAGAILATLPNYASCGRWIKVSVTPVLNGVVGVEKTIASWKATAAGSFAVSHTTDTGAAEVKSINYGLTLVNGQCWITQNLGANGIASDVNPSDPGWYFKFNRKQGYTSTGGGAVTWTSETISETSDWLSVNDPCTQLGGGWRLPTQADYVAITSVYAGGFNGSAFSGLLKLSAAGYLNTAGVLGAIGTKGFYWSSTQSSDPSALYLDLGTSSPNMWSNTKAFGFTVRCLQNQI